MIDLDALAQAAACLEPLPVSTLRLARLVCANGEVPDLDRIIEVVQFDEAVTASLLRSANSSWSASRTEVTTVRDAVVRLGAGPVFALALGSKVRGRMSDAIPEYGLGEKDLWNHSVAAFLAAETIVRKSPRKLPVETITASLLHDVGKLVMSRFLSQEVLDVLDESQAQGATRLASEAEILGVNHAELGGLILQCWALPESLVRGVTYHHTPDASLDPVAYGVHLADVVAKAVLESADDNADLDTFGMAIGELELDADAFDEICSLTKSRFDEVSQVFLSS